MLNPTDMTYFARRAEREAVLAVAAGDGRAAAAHHELSRLYSVELMRTLRAAPRPAIERDNAIAR